MQLKSHKMALNGREKRWLPWFGTHNKWALRWASLINRSQAARRLGLSRQQLYRKLAQYGLDL